MYTVLRFHLDGVLAAGFISKYGFLLDEDTHDEDKCRGRISFALSTDDDPETHIYQISAKIEAFISSWKGDFPVSGIQLDIAIYPEDSFVEFRLNSQLLALLAKLEADLWITDYRYEIGIAKARKSGQIPY